MTTVTVTEARKRLYNLVDQTIESHEPVHIAGKRGGAVLLSDEDWSSIQETLFLLSIPGMRDAIRKGLDTPVDMCTKDLIW
jgi:prevent-host-death family protein